MTLRAGVLALIGLTIAAAAGWTVLRPQGPALIAGVRLGMAETRAFARLQAMDPLADLGGYCGNDDGILAYVDTMGRTWQVMAHLRQARVNEVQLQWSGFQSTPDQAACQQAFETDILPQLRQHFGLSQFEGVAKGTEGYAEILQAGMADTPITVSAIVQRLEGKNAACNVTVVMSQDGAEPYFRVQLLPPDRQV